jgi:hypothetical protein
MASHTLLFEITLSDWTESNKNATFNYVKIYETEGKIIMTQLKKQPQTNYVCKMPNKLVCQYAFAPLELKMLRQNLDTILRATKTFTFSFAPLGFEYNLEQTIQYFEMFIQNYKKEMFDFYHEKYGKTEEKNAKIISDLCETNDQLQRNYNKYKYEFNELALDYHRMNDKSLYRKNIDLLTQNHYLAEQLEKEKYEKEQFIAYCENLNDKIVSFADDDSLLS